MQNLTNPFWIEGNPGATQSVGWLGAWETAVSPYAVAAESADDIAAAVDFARDNNVRLVVKGAGHDYLGRNTASDSGSGRDVARVDHCTVRRGCVGPAARLASG
jgi:FAD/FMN-containing dehydrogenase